MGKVSVETGTFQDSICEGAVDNHRFKIAFGKVCSWNHRFKIAFGKVCRWNHRFKIAVGKICSCNHRFKISIWEGLQLKPPLQDSIWEGLQLQPPLQDRIWEGLQLKPPVQESFWEGCHLKSGIKNPYPVDPKHLKSYFRGAFFVGVSCADCYSPGGGSNIYINISTQYMYTGKSETVQMIFPWNCWS